MTSVYCDEANGTIAKTASLQKQWEWEDENNHISSSHSHTLGLTLFLSVGQSIANDDIVGREP